MNDSECPLCGAVTQVLWKPSGLVKNIPYILVNIRCLSCGYSKMISRRRYN